MIKKITIRHHHSGAAIYEYEPTESEHSSGMTMRAALESAAKSRANLSGADLSGANLYGANLYGANLYGASLSRANLSRANLYGANLYGAHLYGARLSEANLYGANLSRANLSEANLSRANLSRANLYGANLSGADLSGANLSEANLSGANLYENKLVGKRPIIMIGPIGSRSDYLTAYMTDAGVMLRAGCFFGTRDGFVAACVKTHGDNEHGREYAALLAYIDAHAAIWAGAAR